MKLDDRELLLVESAIKTWMTVAQETLNETEDEDEIAEITNDLTAMEILLFRIQRKSSDS